MSKTTDTIAGVDLDRIRQEFEREERARRRRRARRRQRWLTADDLPAEEDGLAADNDELRLVDDYLRASGRTL